MEWLAHGDKNTHFFHLQASMRRRKNLIKSLARANGGGVDDPNELEAVTIQFYKDLFTSKGVSNMHEVLNVVPNKISAEMATFLSALSTLYIRGSQEVLVLDVPY